MNLIVETTRSQKTKLEIPVPFFAHNADKSDYVALLDEKTVVNVYQSSNYTLIKNTTPNYSDSLLAEAKTSWVECKEEEFLDRYEAVVESISLRPKVIA